MWRTGGSRERFDVQQFYGPLYPDKRTDAMGKTLRWVIPGSRLLLTHRAARLQSGSPAMGVVKLPRVCELSFHSKSDEVASKGVKREGLSLWDVLPRVCGGHAALTVQPAIRVRQTLIWSRFTLCFIRARRGKRAHPISNREFAQGSRRARAADQSHWAKKSEALRF